MKILKIAAFTSVALYFILDVVYKFEQTMLGPMVKYIHISDMKPGMLSIIDKLYVIEGYKDLTLFFAVPIILIYLFKRLN